MNGRIERMDGRLEIVSEMNYQTINDELEADRKRRIRRRVEGWLAFAGLVGYWFLIAWKAAKGL